MIKSQPHSTHPNQHLVEPIVTAPCLGFMDISLNSIPISWATTFQFIRYLLYDSNCHSPRACQSSDEIMELNGFKCHLYIGDSEIQVLSLVSFFYVPRSLYISSPVTGTILQTEASLFLSHTQLVCSFYPHSTQCVRTILEEKKPLETVPFLTVFPESTLMTSAYFLLARTINYSFLINPRKSEK